MRKRTVFLVATVILLGGMGQTRLAAAEKTQASVKPALRFELNTAHQQKNACRLSFMAKNEMQRDIANLVLELVVFETGGKMLQLFSASFGAMPKSKTRLKQYDIPNLTCDKIGRILLNDVTDCTGDKLTPNLCTAVTQTSSRVKIKFDF